jgi:hypothetical protein
LIWYWKTLLATNDNLSVESLKSTSASSMQGTDLKSWHQRVRHQTHIASNSRTDLHQDTRLPITIITGFLGAGKVGVLSSVSWGF